MQVADQNIGVRKQVYPAATNLSRSIPIMTFNYLQDKSRAWAELQISQHLGFVCKSACRNQLHNIVRILVALLVLCKRRKQEGGGAVSNTTSENIRLLRETRSCTLPR